MRKLTIIISGLLMFGSSGLTQVEVDKPIQLTGTGSNAKITGIDEVTGSKDATSVKSIQAGGLIFATTGGTADAIELTLDPAPDGYLVGMTVHFRAAGNNTGPVSVDVNGIGAVPLHKYVTEPLEAGDILSGQMVIMMFDGSAFQIMSKLGTPPAVAVSNLDYDLSVDKTSTYTNPGFSTSHDPIGIQASLISGFAAVSLIVNDVPPGVTYSISPGGGFPTFSSVLTFNVSSAVAPGSYTMTLVGNGGMNPESVEVTLNVLPVKRAFVTSGSLATTQSPAQRDALCASEATNAGLSGTYKAWISNGSANNVTASSGVSYRLVNEDLVAWTWSDLVDGTLANPINRTANNTSFTGAVYTGLNNDGTVGSQTCQNWTSLSSSQSAIMGNAGAATEWSNTATSPCGTPEVEVGETLNSNNCFACSGNMYFTVGTCGSGCGIYNLDANCNAPGGLSMGPFTYYNCMRLGTANSSPHYCFQE